MYRRNYQSEELLTNVIITFIASLVVGFFISWKLVGEDTFDAEMIVYLVIGGLLGLSFLFSLVLFFVGNRRTFVDIEIDFGLKTIRTFNGFVSYSFEDIQLYSYNQRHHQVRIFVKNRILGFSIDEVFHSTDGALTIEQAAKIGEYAKIVKPKQLYNYSLLASFVYLGLTIFYIVTIGKPQIELFGWTYIPTYFAFVGLVVMIAVTMVLHNYLLKRLYKAEKNEIDTTQE